MYLSRPTAQRTGRRLFCATKPTTNRDTLPPSITGLRRYPKNALKTRLFADTVGKPVFLPSAEWARKPSRGQTTVGKFVSLPSAGATTPSNTPHAHPNKTHTPYPRFPKRDHPQRSFACFIFEWICNIHRVFQETWGRVCCGGERREVSPFPRYHKKSAHPLTSRSAE